MKIRLWGEWNERIAFVVRSLRLFLSVPHREKLRPRLVLTMCLPLACIHLSVHIAVYIEWKISSCPSRHGQRQTADEITCSATVGLAFDRSVTSCLPLYLGRFLIELVLILPPPLTDTIDYSHAAVSTSNDNGYSCDPILSTPFNVDMVVR